MTNLFYPYPGGFILQQLGEGKVVWIIYDAASGNYTLAWEVFLFAEEELNNMINSWLNSTDTSVR